MSAAMPSLRMFAGPNGSGKTTLKNGLRKSAAWFGTYINPDDIEKDVKATGFLSLRATGLTVAAEEIRSYLAASDLLRRSGRSEGIEAIRCRDGGIDFGELPFDSYHASVTSDFLRRKALAARRSFAFETVMSAPDKVDFLREAQACGFRTYLYFTATEDPEINVQRVKNRVADGGHDVPTEKIVARYGRSLQQLREAVRHTHLAYFFDTSHADPWYFAEMTDGIRLEMKSPDMPRWFAPLWERYGSGSLGAE